MNLWLSEETPKSKPITNSPGSIKTQFLRRSADQVLISPQEISNKLASLKRKVRSRDSCSVSSSPSSSVQSSPQRITKFPDVGVTRLSKSVPSSNMSTERAMNLKIEEIPSEELSPCKHPEIQLKNAIDNLNASNWETQFHSITTIRRIAIFHKDLLIPHLHKIVLKIGKFVNNLRSSLSKNAIICLDDLFVNLKTQMDSELEHIIPILLKKTGEVNRFINNQAERALHSLISNTSQSKTLSLLISLADHKNASIRAESAMFISECVDALGTRIFKFKDFQKLLYVNIQFLNDGSYEARTWGKRIAWSVYDMYQKIYNDDNFDNFLKRYLNDRELKDFKDAIAKEKYPSYRVKTVNN